MAKKFFNIVSGAHEGVRSVVFSQRVLSEPIDGLEVGMAIAPSFDGKYRQASQGSEAGAEFVFETDRHQSSGTVTTVWGIGEFETNNFDEDNDIAPGNFLRLDDDGRVMRDSDPQFPRPRWICLSNNNKTIRFKVT